MVCTLTTHADRRARDWRGGRGAHPVRVCEDATLTRTGLSREVAGWLGWRDAWGRLRDMSCRVVLLELARRGVIELPPALPVSFTPAVDDAAELVTIDTTLALGPVELVRVTDHAASRTWRAVMAYLR